jgi:hypothetical protein
MLSLLLDRTTWLLTNTTSSTSRHFLSTRSQGLFSLELESFQGWKEIIGCFRYHSKFLKVLNGPAATEIQVLLIILARGD